MPKCHYYVLFPYTDSAALCYEGAKYRGHKVEAQKFGAQNVGRKVWSAKYGRATYRGATYGGAECKDAKLGVRSTRALILGAKCWGVKYGGAKYRAQSVYNPGNTHAILIVINIKLYCNTLLNSNSLSRKII